MNAKYIPFTLTANLAISPEIVLEQAFQTGFCKRIGKIHPCGFWETFCVESIRGTLSYNDFAARVESQRTASVSRQALAYKTSDAGGLFFERMLAVAMAAKLDGSSIQQLRTQGPFTRIIVQDSTVIRLPERLYSIFSGVKNAHKTACNARVQGVYDILAGRLLHYSIDPYSRNDLAAALDFSAQPGDLVLKDRGYYRAEAIEKDIAVGADCIFRYKHPSLFHSIETEERLNLAKLLKNSGSLDMEVLLGSEKNKQVPVRLVAFPVREEVANLRRMKAKKESKPPNRSPRYTPYAGG